MNTDDLIARAEAALEGYETLDYLAFHLRNMADSAFSDQIDADRVSRAASIVEIVPDLLAHIAAQAAEIKRLRAERDAAWCAGRDAAADRVKTHWYGSYKLDDDLRALTPPETEGRG